MLVDPVLAESLLSRAGLAFASRWLHVLAGVAWLAFLVVVSLAPARRGAEGRSVAAWFRFAALLTLLTGLGITVAAPDYFSEGFGRSSQGTAISAGMALGILMVVNVWVVVWRAQKVVLAADASGQDGAAERATRRAEVAARQNLVFSLGVVWFMTYTAHGPRQVAEVAPVGLAVFWVVLGLVTFVLELNGLGLMPWRLAPGRGLNVLYDTATGWPLRNVAVAAVGFWLLCAALAEVCFRA